MVEVEEPKTDVVEDQVEALAEGDGLVIGLGERFDCLLLPARKTTLLYKQHKGGCSKHSIASTLYQHKKHLSLCNNVSGSWSFTELNAMTKYP